MLKTINFGIDLGTTNSLIARCKQGQVEVFKNPSGFKETLPSVVGFRNDRILIGDAARNYVEKDPNGVASQFKRKMGTTETVKITSIGSKTPIELSALVLKELKNFVRTEDDIEAAVITIPASFDMVQANATKDAGLAAGFKHVVLLQEPIAASLAYANKEMDLDLSNSQWVVYDLGGGTFDVALVRIVEGELTIIDHEGDNYLGGADFDMLIVDKFILPAISKLGRFENIDREMKSSGGKYNKQWYVLLNKAEQAKIELSARNFTEIELDRVDLMDADGVKLDTVITITRDEFESAIKPSVDSTIEMIRRMLTRNSLQPRDLSFILMVGGSTYIPFVKKRVEALLEVPTNTSIDPTNAIAIGAAFFSATKSYDLGSLAASQPSSGVRRIRASYNRNSQELEETFTAKIEGETQGLSYRIINEDRSFDSGIRPATTRIFEDLPLRKGAYNLFEFQLLDVTGNQIETDLKVIEIAQGKYNVAGQPLPEDISLVLDDISKKDTRLEKVFPRNAILPIKTKRTREIGKTIVKGSNDDLRIVVVEGPSDRHSTTNKPIGIMTISGKELSKDLFKGTEIDLTFELSDDRILTVSAYINGTGQEFSKVFDTTLRHVDIKTLTTDILNLESKIQDEVAQANEIENNNLAEKLEASLRALQPLISSCASMAEDDVTDTKFQIEDRKRHIAQQIYEITSSNRIEAAKRAFEEIKQVVAKLVEKNGNDKERHDFSLILQNSNMILNSTSLDRIESAMGELQRFQWRILVRLPDFLISWYDYLKDQRPLMNDPSLAKQLLDAGDRYINAEAWDDLRTVNIRLDDLLPSSESGMDNPKLYTGIV